jgi:8-oxo-dGTP pyrophosphatase MutT (NUDIX family)
MPRSKAKTARRQYGALPFRVAPSGEISIMLVTTRGSGRWIARLRPRQVAEREAFEEAGLIGQMLGKKPIGCFTIEKRADRGALTCEVRVYAMAIHHQLPDWPERAERETRWFAPAAAAAAVDDQDLASLLLGLPETVRRGGLA